jgi:hypothetical protein
MKIAMGIDRTDTPELIGEYAAHGVDDFFAGYIPPEWSNQYGWEVSLNRRPFGPDAQHTNLADLKSAVRAVHEHGCRIALTINAHQHCADQLDLIERVVGQMEEGRPDAYIVADPAIMMQLREWGIDRPLHLSTGVGSFNAETVRYCCTLGDVKRVVVPRKMSMPEMRTLIDDLDGTELEFEAMILGYRCLFNDEYCFTWHCGTRSIFCKHFFFAQKSVLPRYPGDWKDRLRAMLAAPQDQLAADSPLDRFVKDVLSMERREQRQLAPRDVSGGREGLSARLAHELYQNCGLCAIGALRDAGIDVLKLPSRGELQHKLDWIELLKAVLESPDESKELCRKLINSPGYCEAPGSCYYAR